MVIFEEDITKENDKYRIRDFNQSCSGCVLAFDSKDDERARNQIGDDDEYRQS